MRSAARTIAASAPALAVVAVAWLRLEQPVGSLWPVLALLGLALAAAVPTHRWLRAVGAVAAARFAGSSRWSRLSRGAPPSGSIRPRRLALHPRTRFGNGFSDFYGTHLPFDPRVHARCTSSCSGLFLFALA